MRSIIANMRGGMLGIGAQGENKSTKVVFNIAGYESFTILLLHKRYGDTLPYEVQLLTVDTNAKTATWIVDSTDTSIVGKGYLEMQFRDSDTIAKTITWLTSVTVAITESTVNPPDPYTQWYDKMVAEAAAAKASEANAETYKEAAEDAADSAEADAKTASDAATAASASETAAGKSATDASESAEEIKDLTVSASVLPAGSEATVTKTGGSGTPYHLAFGVPKGDSYVITEDDYEEIAGIVDTKIDAQRAQALQDISDAEDVATGAISQAQDTATGAISSAQGAALGAISSAQGTATSAISQAQKTATDAVYNQQAISVGAVSTEGDTQVQKVKDEGSSYQEQITELQTESSQLKTGLSSEASARKKEDSAIWAALSGTVVEEETVPSTAYTVTVPDRSIMALVNKTGGKSAVWNQLFSIDYFGSASTRYGVTVEISGTSAIKITNNERTENYANGAVYGKVQFCTTIGHVYYTFSDVVGVGTNISGYACNKAFKSNTIADVLVSLSKDYDFVDTHPIGDVTIATLAIIDMTQMYGCTAVSDVTDDMIATCKAIYAADPSYNAGVIKHALLESFVAKDADGNVTATNTIPTDMIAFIENDDNKGIWGAGINDTCYNVCDFEKAKFNSLIGMVNLKDLSWKMISVTEGNMFRTALPSDCKAGNSRYVSNALCNRYPITASNTRYNISLNINETYIDVVDSTYSSADAFKQAMADNSVVLYYEKATAAETDISDYVTDDLREILTETGGTITFVQTGDTRIPIPNEIAYCEKLEA